MTSTESSTGTTGDRGAVMDDLIARLERAHQPDRLLDGAIALACGWTLQKMKGDQRTYYRKPGVTEYYNRSEPPEFTTSIDAAMTLVPAGHDYGFSFSTQHGLETWVQKPFKGGTCHQGYAPEGIEGDSTRALALCIAALRATAALKDHQS